MSDALTAMTVAGIMSGTGEAGWDPSYGARPLKRAIQRLLENPLALRLLEGDFVAGDTVLVDAQAGDLVFTKAGFAAAEVAP